MAKTLKLYNGRGHGKYNRCSIYIAAYSRAEAQRMLEQACNTAIGKKEIKEYYSECWGNAMTAKVPNPDKPQLWVNGLNHDDTKLKQII